MIQYEYKGVFMRRDHKSLQFKIIKEHTDFAYKDKESFKDIPNYPIQYILVLTHAIFEQMKQSTQPVRENDIRDMLKWVKNISKADNEAVCFDKIPMLKLMLTKTPTGNGITLVDRSKGVFPLVLFPEKDVDKDSDRLSAFIQTLDAFLEKYDEIVMILEKELSNVWSSSIQNEILKIVEPTWRKLNNVSH